MDEDDIPDGTSTALKLSEAYSEQSVFLQARRPSYCADTGFQNFTMNLQANMSCSYYDYDQE